MSEVILKLSAILQKIIQEQSLVQSFEWAVPKSSPIAVPHFDGDFYQQNVYLKQNFAVYLRADSSLRSHYWLIQEWGGIKSFKQSPQNDKKIRYFLEILSTGKPSSKLYDTLPSLSKVSSFLHPEDYVIYDARVIYSLNWLIFSHDLDMNFFPQPVSRNAQLLKFEQRTIFNLFHSARDFVPKPEAYLKLCVLMKALTEVKDSPWRKPYEIEMLLFSIAPNYIVNDIQRRIGICMK